MYANIPFKVSSSKVVVALLCMFTHMRIHTVLLCFFEDCTSEKPVAATRHIEGFVGKEKIFDRDEEEEEGRKRRKKKVLLVSTC
jgi:hypothetical protein